MSVTDFTTAAAWMAGLALLALVFTGWRKPARAQTRKPRREPIVRRPWEPIGVAETTTTLDRRPGPLRRLWAVVASSGLAVVIGALIAVVVAFGTGYLVVTLTDLLKQ